MLTCSCRYWMVWETDCMEQGRGQSLACIIAGDLNPPFGMGLGWFSDNFWCGRQRLLGLKCRSVSTNPGKKTTIINPILCLVCFYQNWPARHMVMCVLLVDSLLEKDSYRYVCMEHGGYLVVKDPALVTMTPTWHVLRASNLATVENVTWLEKKLSISNIQLNFDVYFGTIHAGISQFHDGRYAHHAIPFRRFRARGVYCNGRETNISSCSFRDITCPQKCDGSEMGLKCDYGELIQAMWVF